ncbi:hypothetical protein PR003_g13154 [Phytophthora rubi]|uniref:Uncharacterized protein n=1 Tax=Phytophthora rubi TaxID=129364 RepID=A0A6A3LHJ2_9STRA|nr:hypothetical protein PR002_g14118 [Phytophthora rubi]KAE9018030.1 hypothetical protein PR001_g14247 [Phytophthora rubi]KAE9335155.1 hypothetical protein PR003_g13154 [Phytophthora rubi]
MGSAAYQSTRSTSPFSLCEHRTGAVNRTFCEHIKLCS